MSHDITLITGAGSGIGRAISLMQAAAGIAVALVDRDETSLRKVADEAKALGSPGVAAIPADISSEAAVIEGFRYCRELLGVPTRVVANAGIEISVKAHETELADWERVIDTNLTGTFITCREAIRLLLEHDLTGSLVCISSPSAVTGFAGGANSAYGSSKGAISALVRALAIDYAPSGIRVNGVIPGATATPLLDVVSTDTDSVTRRAKQQIPLGRLARPEEIAEAVDWLLGPKAGYVTGSHIYVDGGLTARSANDF
jgi:NAD(P)-dependent dehydrogenase (short-subunit alcohol dehydrogenase family)